MSEPEPIAPEAIAATNVRPAFEVSLHFGATEAELEEHTGLTRALVESNTATVPGEATYRHMELMFGKPGYPRFVTSAAALHTAKTLGVVGLAAKTTSTVEAAMRCHHRFQHLTNRTARYESSRKGGRFVLEEIRDSDRLGALLISDYTMLVAMQLIRDAADGVTPQAMRSRRASLPEAEREAYEQFIGAPIVTGAERSSLIFDESIADLPVPSADPELADYFAGVLAAADRFGESTPEPPLIAQVRRTIRQALLQGTPTATEVAAALSMTPRTLQRRLADHNTRFGELLDTTRQHLAEAYLTDPTLSLAEIAYLLGFREQASFFRAFRRWTGQTPREFVNSGDVA